MPGPGPVVTLLVVAAVVVLGGLHARGTARERRERAAILDDVVPLFAVAPGRDAAGLPTLAGRAGGREVTVRLVVDSLTLRKLPVLWLEVTVAVPLAVRGPLTVLLRPQGTEFFSPDGAFAHELTAPGHWPRPCRVSTPDPARSPDPAMLDGAVGLLHEPRTKEVALGPRGVRVVRMAAECEQGSYRAARRAVFGPVRVAREEVEAVLDVAAAVVDRAGEYTRPTRSAP